MLRWMINQYWGGKELNRILTREEKSKIIRAVAKTSKVLDNYLPGQDTLKIACEVCESVWNGLAAERREREINMADYGYLDQVADYREE